MSFPSSRGSIVSEGKSYRASV